MKTPVDFVLRTVSLWNGANVVIYEGNHPKDALAGTVPKQCPSVGDVYQCKFATSADAYDLLYQASANSPSIQIRITGITPANQAGVAEFLEGFRRCRAAGQSELCTDQRPFVGIEASSLIRAR
ncbi:MAG TPA: hypothetical protein VFG49_03385 [Dyella sp.]|uniref:hypothetical protein n=1 Tax=Dyella sp. TaxID=1869338 RepID=UPI002D777D58|nr:hypothetical protein [Dyella sp.]HET6552556.1 hypothetical protein [Dyella sp.]